MQILGLDHSNGVYFRDTLVIEQFNRFFARSVNDKLTWVLNLLIFNEGVYSKEFILNILYSELKFINHDEINLVVSRIIEEFGDADLIRFDSKLDFYQVLLDSYPAFRVFSELVCFLSELFENSEESSSISRELFVVIERNLNHYTRLVRDKNISDSSKFFCHACQRYYVELIEYLSNCFEHSSD